MIVDALGRRALVGAIVDPSGRRVYSDPREQAMGDALFGLNRDVAASIFGHVRGTILDERGRPMNRAAPARSGSPRPMSGLEAWIPAVPGGPRFGDWALKLPTSDEEASR